jgi:hypothetical protein
MSKTQFSPWLRYAFGLTLFFSALSGFAQMPIFKRYYIADLPGLGWLAQFYTTFYIHYISAIALMAILAYMITTYWLAHRRTSRVGLWGYLRGSVLLIILATGVMLVFRNMPGYRFSPLFVAILDFTHLGMVMLFLLVQIAALIGRRSWLISQ